MGISDWVSDVCPSNLSSNANAYNALGYTYADQNRLLDEAEDLLERALDLDPDNPYILDSVGWYLFRVGDYEAAIEYLERSSIGRASCREGVCQSVSISVVAVSIKKKQ